MLIKFDYLKQKYGINSTGVVHIGASSGQEAEMYFNNGMKKMIWIEAIPAVFAKLKLHIAKYPEAVAINACLSDEDWKNVEFNISSNDGESSSFLEFGLHEEMHPSVTFVDKIKLITSRFDTLVSEQLSDIYRPSEHTFLNIDVQGAEMHVLRGMGSLVANFKYAYMEVNNAEVYKGCGRVEEVDAMLAQYGFKGVEEKWITDRKDKNKNMWGDKFYIK